ncbi:MAG: hypothetical protein M2R45_00814 [Verrucomicrobia subdivision 3 bacterium]|nr:hypothetical protein [Limisphaerales bacterium]MCS1413080.1 hypothetical protein [Limisphaerales bacterium]
MPGTNCDGGRLLKERGWLYRLSGGRLPKPEGAIGWPSGGSRLLLITAPIDRRIANPDEGLGRRVFLLHDRVKQLSWTQRTATSCGAIRLP